MLQELRQYSNLGTVGYYWDLLNLFYKHPDTDWHQETIDSHFKGKIIEGVDTFDGGLHLLVLSGILEKDINNVYHLTYKFKHRLHTIDHCKGKVLESVLASLKDDEETYILFAPEFCTFDFVNNVIQVNRSAFGLKYANVRDLLINLGFLVPHPNYPDVAFSVNKPHKKLFDRYFTDGIRKRQISPEQLKSIQAQQQENGLIGEKFVLEYETRRIGRADDIEWIAIYDSTAGFDVLSFDSADSAIHDRFIEVKAYSGESPYFYWSRNEVNVAQKKKDNYYLYLVNLNDINNPDYDPIIIQNPVNEILDNEEWDKTIEKYHVTRTNQ